MLQRKLEIRDRVANWGEADFHHHCHRPQRRMAHCDGLRQRAHCRTAHFCKTDANCRVPLCIVPPVTGDNVTSIGVASPSKHQNIFLFKSARQHWDTGIVRLICLDQPQILLYYTAAVVHSSSSIHSSALHTLAHSKQKSWCVSTDRLCVYPDPSLWSTLSQKFGFVGLYISSVLPSLSCHIL